MDLDQDTGHPFAIPDLWRPSKIDLALATPPSLVPGALTVEGDKLALEDVGSKRLPDYGLCNLDEFSWGPPLQELSDLSDLDAPSEVDSSGIEKESKDDAEDAEDIWRSQLDESPSTRLLDWDTFRDPAYTSPPSAYISEAGPEAYDSLLALIGEGHGEHKVAGSLVRADVFRSSLADLALGRSSRLFRWQDDRRIFVSLLGPLRVTGVSTRSIESLCQHFSKSGEIMRCLREELDIASSACPSATKIALRHTIDAVISALQIHLTFATSSAQSLLQLERVFDGPMTLVACFGELQGLLTNALDDETLLSQLYTWAQRHEHRTGGLRQLILHVLSTISQPWLESLAAWIGIRNRSHEIYTGTEKAVGFIRSQLHTESDEEDHGEAELPKSLDLDLIPPFLAVEDAHLILETGKGLRLLRSLHLEHPLAHARPNLIKDSPHLEWAFSWDHIERVQRCCEQYEQSILEAIQEYSVRDVRIPSIIHPTQISAIDNTRGSTHSESTQALKSAMDSPLPDLFEKSDDRLRGLIFDFCKSNGVEADGQTNFEPPLPSTSLLSFSPIFATQARLVNIASLRVLFKEHGLRQHFSIHRRFHLFGDGGFLSRLSHALFDPALSTAEREKGVVRTRTSMGIRLGDRDSWPPASSELRLALMGILSEVYGLGKSPGRSSDDIPGKLSFAIRELSPEEVQKCRDPHGIEALDFLRLRYSPPAALESIMTATALHRYDRIFKFLLRMVRVNFVVHRLFRDVTLRTTSREAGSSRTSLRFRIEAHHFMSSLTSYMFETGIDLVWRRLDRQLGDIERCVEAGERRLSSGRAPSMEELRSLHETSLNHIMFGLLLRRRQEPVMKLLEDIWSIILAFAHYYHESASSRDRDARIGRLYDRFKKRVGLFIGVCRGLSDKGEYGQGKDRGDPVSTNCIDQLVLKLEMNLYYSKGK